MAFITNGTEYHGRENMDINIRPRFFGTKPQEMGVRVIDAQGASSGFVNPLEFLVKIEFLTKVLEQAKKQVKELALPNLRNRKSYLVLRLRPLK